MLETLYRTRRRKNVDAQDELARAKRTKGGIFSPTEIKTRKDDREYRLEYSTYSRDGPLRTRIAVPEEGEVEPGEEEVTFLFLLVTRIYEVATMHDEKDEFVGFIDLALPSKDESPELIEVFFRRKYRGRGLCSTILPHALRKFDIELYNKYQNKHGRVVPNKLKIHIESYSPVAASKCYVHACTQVGYILVENRKDHRSRLEITQDLYNHSAAKIEDDKLKFKPLGGSPYSDEELSRMLGKIRAYEEEDAAERNEEVEHRTKFSADFLQKVFKTKEEYKPEIYSGRKYMGTLIFRRTDEEVAKQINLLPKLNPE